MIVLATKQTDGFRRTFHGTKLSLGVKELRGFAPLQTLRSTLRNAQLNIRELDDRYDVRFTLGSSNGETTRTVVKINGERLSIRRDIQLRQVNGEVVPFTLEIGNLSLDGTYLGSCRS